MINKSELLKRFEKLLWVDDETLVNAENLNRIEDFIDILDLRTRSRTGDVIGNSLYSTMQQVIDRYGGSYWILIDRPQGIYYQWIRSDVDPSSVKQVSYKGMVVLTLKDKFLTSKDVIEIYGGKYWKKLTDNGEFDLWECVANDSCVKMPSFEGMMTFSTLDKEELLKHVEGDWELVPGFVWENNKVKQYVCTRNDIVRAEGIGSYQGIISLSNNLITEEQVKQKYDASKFALSSWSGYIDSSVKEWIRNA